MTSLTQRNIFAKTRRVMRGGAGRVAILSLLLVHLWVPLAAAYQGVAQNVFGEENDYLVICTANGMQVVRWDEAGASGTTQSSEHCLSCLAAPFNAALVASAPVEIGSATDQESAITLWVDGSVLPTTAAFKRQAPRAPPLIS